MKEKTEERILDVLVELTEPRTTQDIADELNLSRSVTSNYLNRLYSLGKVTKEGSKPVLWSLPKVVKKHTQVSGTKADLFSQYIGENGSQKYIIQQCRAAVHYPPHGIPILLTGESGTGKSFLANLVHDYAIEKNILTPNAPFKVLNCADYANNPELLSATLFGYRKGSFTGAEQDTTGLLDAADGGTLFLDEVHRLSIENQEKMFVFMDNGKFMRLGDSGHWQRANVRLVFATTGNPDEVLLETLRRRIGVKLSLPNVKQRPLVEKVKLVEMFYQQEAKHLQKTLTISEAVIDVLISGEIEGNIGGLKSAIRLSCANGHIRQTGEHLNIELTDLPLDYQKVEYEGYNLSLTVLPEDNNEVTNIFYSTEKFADLWLELTNLSTILLTPSRNQEVELLSSYRRVVYLEQESQTRQLLSSYDVPQIVLQKLQRELLACTTRYGLNHHPTVVHEILTHFLFTNSQITQKNPFNDGPVLDELVKKYPRAIYVGQQLELIFQHHDIEVSPLLRILIIMALHSVVEEKIKLTGLLIAHGDTTASSIQSVVNQMHQTYIFEAFDMPVSSSVNEIILKIRELLTMVDTSEGMILLVDMGSLSQLYSSIKDDIKGNLLIINNLTTAISLDIGMKMLQDISFDEISEKASTGYTVESQYFEGLSREANIIISCLSGMGISEKLKEIISAHVPNEQLEVLTIEYQEVQQLIAEKDMNYFEKTRLIITTTDIDELIEVPTLNVYDTLKKVGEEQLWKALSTYISRVEFDDLLKDIVKTFSIDGVASRLTILNPEVVIAEAEYIIETYEIEYGVTLKGYEKLNLFMHLSLMVERLVSDKDRRELKAKKELDEKELAFIDVSKKIMNRTEDKFNIIIPEQEMLLLYEVFKHII